MAAATQTTISVTFKVGDTLTDVTSAVLASVDGTFGIKRTDTGEVLYPSGTVMTKTGTGTYVFTFTDPDYDLTYDYSAKLVYSGRTYYYSGLKTGGVSESTLSGTFVYANQASTDRANYIIDEYLFNPLISFRQITIYNEILQLGSDDKWRATYSNWNSAFPVVVRVNGRIKPLSQVTIDYVNGTIAYTGQDINDDVRVTYNFAYFSATQLESSIHRAIDYINAGPVGPPSRYDIVTAPNYWDSLIADLVVVYCMERLIADFSMWRGRLIYALGSDALQGGGTDAITQLETVKSNTEERLNSSLQNVFLKSPPYCSPATNFYFQSLWGLSGSMRAPHAGAGQPPDYGKLRGARYNVWRKV